MACVLLLVGTLELSAVDLLRGVYLWRALNAYEIRGRPVRMPRGTATSDRIRPKP